MCKFTRTLMWALALASLPAWAEGPPVPRPGKHYKCRITAEYRLRPCAVERRGADTWLVVRGKHLVEFEGRLLADEENPNVIHLVDGRLLGERPFPCSRCLPECAEPGACQCQEVPPTQQSACKAQPLRASLQRRKGVWSGDLGVDIFYGGEPPSKARESYRMELR